MPNPDKELLLGAWLEGTLTPEQREAFETLCSEDEEFSRQVEAANMMMMQAEGYQDQAVPNWEREATFSQPEKARWWQWQGLPAFSMATSALAIVMVLTGVQVKVTDGAMTISFADVQTPQEVELVMAEKLNDFQQSQQLALASYAQALQQQQTDANTQLTNYLLNSSRQERREDFAELVKFINQQRNDDQLFYARQLNKLQQEIYANPEDAGWPGDAQLDTINE